MNKYPSDQSSFVFNIEVLVEGKNNGEALAELIHALNSNHFLDYRILSGIKLGQEIDVRKANSQSIEDLSIQLPPTPSTKEDTPPVQAISNEAYTQSESSNGFDNIRALMKSNSLIRLIVNKGLGIKLSIPCRIINMDEKENLITVYHVDEKQVYTFRMNEIEDFS
ncbi:hypothetical protein FHS15_002021 [Paenibacillus castaneae]|uniref:hypothetical protein n=1 Tax=Paenibacillus castaneae TaxID=474957 RepID=UPI000C9A1EC8|nr:hypothetical protein [Paenibacillus castaneae]NIK76896.1 hypothetical protein [Paenibacillus castaneae]